VFLVVFIIGIHRAQRHRLAGDVMGSHSIGHRDLVGSRTKGIKERRYQV
jgi:hypothetical protein